MRLGIDRALRAVAKSASRTAKRGAVTVRTYRGYGSSSHIFLIGRVLREPLSTAPDGRGLWNNLRTVWRLTRAWGIDDAEIKASFGAVEQTVRTDRDGYFELDLPLPSPPPKDQLWHRIHFRLEKPVAIDVEGDVFIPSDSSGFVVVSDIDDTVMYTGVANKLMMMWRLFVQGAESRTAFPGMISFLQALHQGRTEQSANPMLYVSRAPWAIYGVLDRFFNLNGIPAGPVLFLREWGLTLQHPLPRRGTNHKTDLIRRMIEHYDDLPFVLIGDSGQRDPEIYADIVQQFPDRILAVYIRDVSDDPKRDRAISKMAATIEDSGATLILAPDTMAMARHAAGQGLIAKAALTAIENEIAACP